MTIINPFDLLQDVESDDPSVLLEKVAKRKAEKAAKEQAQARAEAEKEDTQRMASGKYYKPDSGKENEDRLNIRSAGGRSVPESRRVPFETSYDEYSGNRGNARGFSGGYNSYMDCGVNNSVGSGHGYYGGYDNVDFGHQSSKGNEFSGWEDELRVSKMLGLEDGYGTVSVGVDSAPVPRLHKKFGSTRSNNNSRKGWEDYLQPYNRQKERIALDKAVQRAADDINDVTSDEDSIQLTKPATTDDNVVIPKKQEEEDESLDSVPNKGKDQPDKKKDESPVSDAMKDREDDAKLMTLSEFEKLREKKRKPLLANKTIEERKIPVDKAFESMKLLSIKKGNDDEISTKAAPAKAVNQRQGNAGKVKKTLKVTEVLKVTRESSYRFSPRYRQGDQSSDGNQGSARGGYSGGSGQGQGRGDNSQSFRGRGDNDQSFRGSGDGSGRGKVSDRAKTSSSTPSLESKNDFPPL